MAEPGPARRRKGGAPRERAPERPVVPGAGGDASGPAVRVSPWLLVPVALAAGALGYALAPGRAPPTSAPLASSAPSDAQGSVTSSTDRVEPPPPSTPTTSSAPVVAPPGTSASSPADRVARLKAIEAKPARTRSIEENLELERGHVALGVDEVAEIERALGPKFDVALARRLRLLARDAAIAPEVLATIARHPRAELADLLYDVATDTHAPDSVRWLALDLLAADTVRATASMALILALDLPNVRDCETMMTFVSRAKKSADDRSSAALRRLEKDDGCGVDGKADCWACLRGDTLLYETRTAVDSRVYSPPWRMVGRGQ